MQISTMATAPLQTFGRGPTFLDWSGNPVETQQFGDPRGRTRRNPRGYGTQAQRGGPLDDEALAVDAQNIVSGNRAAPQPGAAEPEGTGIFNPMIAAPSESVQAALATPAAQRSLAQKKLLTDRMGTEAMAASRGGKVTNGITQALADEKEIGQSRAQGAYDERKSMEYEAGRDSVRGVQPGVNGTSTNVPGATERAQAQYMPQNSASPLANDSLSAPLPRGFAMRTMNDGTVRTASGFKDGHPNVSNIETFSNEAAAQAATTAQPGSLTPPDPRGMPDAGAGGLPVAQMAMAGPAAAPQGQPAPWAGQPSPP